MMDESQFFSEIMSFAPSELQEAYRMKSQKVRTKQSVLATFKRANSNSQASFENLRI